MMGEAAQAITNEEATGIEKIEVSGGDAPVTFDDLESVAHTQKELRKEEIKQEEEIKKEIAEESGDSSDEGEEDGLQRKEKQSEEEQGQEEVDDGGFEEQDLSDVKHLKLNRGERDYDVPADSVVPVKVNGKLEEVHLQDLVNHYSGKTNWDRKNSELHKERRELEASKQSLQTAVNELHKMVVEEKDMFGAIYVLAETMGADPDQVYDQFMEQINGHVDQMYSLSPEERKAGQLEQRLKLMKRRQEKFSSQSAADKASAEMQQRAERVMEIRGMSEDEIISRYNELSQSGIDKSKITPELVGRYHYNVQLEQRIVSILDEKASDLSKEERKEAVLDLFETITKMEDWDDNKLSPKDAYTDEDIEVIIEQVYGTAAEQKLARKLKQSEKLASKKSVRDPRNDPMFFDDLDEE